MECLRLSVSLVGEKSFFTAALLSNVVWGIKNVSCSDHHNPRACPNHGVSFQRLYSKKCSEFEISNLEILIRALFQEMTQIPTMRQSHCNRALPQLAIKGH